MTTNQMPKIDLDRLAQALSAADFEIALMALNPKTYQLRASKPAVKKDDDWTGLAAYAWRMAAFSISPISKHQCMPVTADFDLLRLFGERSFFTLTDAERDQEHAYRKEMIVRGDAIADAIVKAVPVAEWHGVIRWGQALGRIGTPRYNEEGAVIYR